MEILPGVQISGLGLYLSRHDTIVISDLHVGFEEMLAEHGVLVPRQHYHDITQQFAAVLRGLRKKQVSRIVINGDFKHDFGRITSQEWREVLRFIDHLLERCRELVLVRGNHDIALGPVARKRKISVVARLKLGDVLLLHGDRLEPIRRDIGTVIIGHEHPAITLHDPIKKETYKCFLVGKFRKRKLILVPSFNPMLPGTDVLAGNFLSPFLDDIENFRALIIEDNEALDFGEIGKLRKKLPSVKHF